MAPTPACEYCGLLEHKGSCADAIAKHFEKNITKVVVHRPEEKREKKTGRV
jgi:DTW domain-containing protein YfiP